MTYSMEKLEWSRCQVFLKEHARLLDLPFFIQRGDFQVKCCQKCKTRMENSLEKRDAGMGHPQTQYSIWHWSCGSFAVVGNFWGCKILLFTPSSGWIKCSQVFYFMKYEIDINTTITTTGTNFRSSSDGMFWLASNIELSQGTFCIKMANLPI